MHDTNTSHSMRLADFQNSPNLFVVAPPQYSSCPGSRSLHVIYPLHKHNLCYNKRGAFAAGPFIGRCITLMYVQTRNLNDVTGKYVPHKFATVVC